MMTTIRIRNLLLSGVAAACLMAVAGAASAAGYGGAPIRSPYEGYDAALQQRYEAMADMEAAENDSTDAWAYGNKAVAARDGFLVLPDDPENYNLNPEDTAFAHKIYAHLLSAYLSGAPGAATADMADAQVNFDCWMSDTEEGTNPTRAKNCHARVVETMARISGPDSDVPAAVRAYQKRFAAKSGTAAVDDRPLPVLPISHRMMFKFDSAALDADSLTTLREVVRHANAYPRAAVHVTGHTDRAGDATYNHALAQKRAANVAVALSLRGIKLDRIDEIQLGEDAPAVATADGVAEARNRRVEILIDNR